MSDPKNPFVGDMHIDATGIATVDLTPEFLNTLTKLREGHDKATANVARLTPEQLKAAGLNAEQVNEIVQLAAEHKQIGALYEASAKMTEVLRDTHLDRGHILATRLAELVEQARRRADRSPNGAEILGPFGDLLDYQLGPAQRAALTKVKKAAPSKQAEPAKPIG